MAGMALKLPELAISDDEARDLADAILICGREYGVKITGKTAASLNLLATVIVVYAPKMAAVWMRGKMMDAPKPAESNMPSATSKAAKSVFDISAKVGKPDWAN